MIYNYTLENGIRVIVKKMSGMFSVSTAIMVGAGSVCENEKENGISHFIEHVTFKGTNKRSSFQISSDIDALGGQINAYTSKEYTCYYVKSLAEHTEKTFEILSDIFNNSVYDNAELDKEKGVIIEEINMYEDTPDEVCLDALSSAYFGKNGFGAPILGNLENVSSFTQKDVFAFRNKFYTTDNIVISFAGNIEPQRALDLVNKYFFNLKKTTKAERPNINTVNLCGKTLKNKPIEQVHLALGLSAASINDENSLKYSLVSSVLGNGMSSRLFQTIREKLGLCYSIYSYTNGYGNCGTMSIYAGVNKESYKKAYESILLELKKLKSNGVEEDEFSRNLEQSKSSLLLSEESTASQIQLYGRYLLLTDKIFDMESKIKDIYSMKLKDVNEFIVDRMDIENISSSVVGNGVEILK